MNSKNKIKKNRAIKEWGRAFVLALILLILVKGFVIESFVVSSKTMEKTLQSGDYVFVNKLKHGARLPITLLSLPFASNIYSTLIELQYIRMPGFGAIERNDLIVFNYPKEFDPPIDKKKAMVKRCIGLPGDTIQIENKNVFVNHRKFEEPATAQYNFRLVTDGTFLDDDFLNKYDITEGGLVSDIGIYDFALSRNKIEEIKKNESQVRYIRELKDFKNENSGHIFPISSYYTFNKDYFGEIIVPKKGMVVPISARTMELYRPIIEYYEGNEVVIRNNRVYINGKESDSYLIKENYYFVLDDNRDYAKDSRYFGYVPENHVIGNVLFSWFSIDKSRKKIRWDRVFKSVD
ncbi:MAG: signal peptidase I [Salinivirgaceae bacterium]|nr:signal peptidase I [Salinivirgaceae bacterium]